MFKDFFKGAKAPSQLQEKIQTLFPNKEEDDLLILSCVAGLMTKVAASDLSIDQDEKNYIQQVLSKLSAIDQNEAQKVLSLAEEEVTNLMAPDSHKYAHHLKDRLPENQRYEILEVLFALAASDGEAQNNESEQIRIISQGLGLTQQHFIAARATVKDKLSALK